MKKLSIPQLLGINTCWLGLSFMWNSLHPIVLPAVLLHMVPAEAKNSWLGLLTFGGVLLAMLIQPLSGAASDRWRSRLGRRRPLAILGTSLDFIFLALLAWSGNLAVVILGYFGLQLASNIAHGPLQGLLPDLVPRDQLGRAAALKNLMEMGGLILASMAAGRLLSPADPRPTAVVLIIMAVLALSALLTFLSARENSTLSEETGGEKGLRSLRELIPHGLFQVDWKANRDFFLLVASRFVFLLGLYGVQTFVQYYIQDVMRAQNPVRATGELMVTLALTVLVCGLLGGWLTDRIGARRVILAASLLSSLACLLLVTAADLASLNLYAGVLGAGLGLYLTSNWALASRLAPQGEAGKYLGLTNLATAGASVASKLLGVPIDMLNHSSPGQFLGYRGLFLLASLGALFSLLLFRQVRELQALFRNNLK